MTTPKPQLAQCPRCQGYVLRATLGSGLLAAVDIAPLDTQGFANAVVHRVGLWWLIPAPDGTPGRLAAPSGPPRPSWGPNGAQSGSQRLHAEHSCGALAKDMRVVQLKGGDTGPQRASATSGRPEGGFPHPDALAGAPGARTHPSPATPATRRPSKPPVCHICDRVIKDGEEPFWGFEHPPGTWIYAEHEECP